MMCLAAIAFPVLANTIARIKVRTTMGELSGLVQNCRSIAVRKDKTKSVHFATASGLPVAFTQDCCQAADISAIIPGEDKPLYLPTGFSVASSGIPTPLVTATIWGNSSTPATTDITYNSRGIPCDLSTTPCSGPKGFVEYLKYRSSGDKDYWIALTVSPAGRVKVYYWNDSNQWGN